MSENHTTLLERLWASDEASALTNEAAREIERLRAGLAEIVKATDCGAYYTARRIAAEVIGETDAG